MSKRSPVSVFLAATSLMVASTASTVVHAQDGGGLKEWTTDQAVEDKSKMDADAAAIQRKAELEDVCVPVGEGENCW
ncbi:MAG: hypothetical protein CMN96_09700 [Synechococcus sp. MED850]|nr:hypothetical protein [Synechococcus sp. MED850]